MGLCRIMCTRAQVSVEARGNGSPVAEVTRGCKLSDMGAENGIWVLCKSSIYS